MIGNSLRITMSSNRPPSLKHPDSPPTPAADLSEYTPSDEPGTNSAFTPNKDKPETPTADLSDVASPEPTRNEANEFQSSTHHQSVNVGVTSPTNAKQESPRLQPSYTRWYLFLFGILLGAIFNLFSLVAIPLVNGQIRLFFVVGCIVGALIQGAVGLTTYKQVVL